MKKILSLWLLLCLLLSLFPAQALAYAGDIRPADGSAVKQTKLSSGSLALENDYIRVIARKDGTLSTAPAAESAAPTDRQTPFCYFITYEGYSYNIREVSHPASLRLKSLTFVNRTPNGAAKALKAEYDLTVTMFGKAINGTTAVYHELVQIAESIEDTWGALTTVDSVQLNIGWDLSFGGDIACHWGYTLSGFTGMGHTNATDSPAIKLNRTFYNWETKETTAESTTVTGATEDMPAYITAQQGKHLSTSIIHEVYTDGYPWANPFVGLSVCRDGSSVVTHLPNTVSVTPASRPADTRIVCTSPAGFHFLNDDPRGISHFLWGFHNLVVKPSEVPSEPDKVDPTIYARRLAVFARRDGVMVLPVASDAALSALKLIYGDPISFINGNYESKNGTEFTFTGGAALLSPSVTATWGSGGSLVIHWDGRVEQRGVHLSAPSFKFYQPKSGSESSLKIKLTNKGFSFDIDPTKNEAIVFVDIPYATVKLESATTNGVGDLVLGGGIGFRTVLNGAEFNMEKLGFGLNEKKEFKVNGVKASGKFDTAKLMALELAKVEGEVNTFKGEERYAFELELNAFDLFETEAKLALERSKKDGSLIPDELWFYVKANPGIPLIPPVPVGQLNGGGAGFKDLAATVNGNYFAIPPLKLRGALTGTYLHLIEGTGNVVLGPSEISLKATDVKLVGTNASVVKSFGYALKLNGQERHYKGTDYTGIYFVGSKELELNLPNDKINALVLKSSIDVGAFGGVNAAKDRLYLGVGANAIVTGRVQVPDDIRVIGGIGVDVGNINLVIGGHTTTSIGSGTSVSDGMKQAFKNMDVYLGAMVGVNIRLVDTRVWVLVPQIVQTNFRRGEGWNFEISFIKSLPKWNWADKGIEPIVQAVALEESGETLPVLMASAPAMLTGGAGSGSTDISVTATEGQTPYIVLAFDNSVTEEQIRAALKIEKDGSTIDINWLGENGEMDPAAPINAMTVSDMKKTEDDDKTYRLAILRLKEGGSYSVSAGALPFSDAEGVSVAPFETLELAQSGSSLTGQVKHPEAGASYVLRTYLGTKQGGADYLVDEREVNGSGSISLTLPGSGLLAPTGEYYVTSFLMTEKTFKMEDGTQETALMAIDSKVFDDTVTYTNTKQPEAPGSVSLEFTGNEVMRAAWQAVPGADGYRVTIYRLDEKGAWVDSGFGYDLKNSEDGQPVTAIDMALTVGGNGVAVSESGSSAASVPAENLQPNEKYKVGVSAYRTEEGGKYYSTEVQSSEEFLPEYKPLSITLTVGEQPCSKDENGVFHAYVGGSGGLLTVTCAGAEKITVTRMDTDADIAPDSSGSFPLPKFTGTLMLRVRCEKDKDVTDAFLLVSVDETPPVLTLAESIFYADAKSGAYTITGTADAGSQILYGESESTHAAGDGSFTISGTLGSGENNGALSLCAQDAAGNTSARQLALVARRPSEHTVTFDGNGGTPSVSDMTTAEQKLSSLPSASRGGSYRFDGWYTERSGGTKITTDTVFSADTILYAHWTRIGGGGGSSGGGSAGSGGSSGSTLKVGAGGSTQKVVPGGEPLTAPHTLHFETGGGSELSGVQGANNAYIDLSEYVPTRQGYTFTGWYSDRDLTSKVDGVYLTEDTTVYAGWRADEAEAPDTVTPEEPVPSPGGGAGLWWIAPCAALIGCLVVAVWQIRRRRDNRRRR